MQRDDTQDAQEMALAAEENTEVPEYSEAAGDINDEFPIPSQGLPELPMPDLADNFKPRPEMNCPDASFTLQPPNVFNLPPSLDLHVLSDQSAATLTASLDDERTVHAQTMLSMITACYSVVDENIRIENAKLERSLEAVNQQMNSSDRVEMPPTPNYKFRDGIPDLLDIESFQRNKLDKVAFPELKDTKILESQDDESTSFRQSLLTNLSTMPKLELGQGTSDPNKGVKSNKPNIKKLISDISKEYAHCMIAERKNTSISKPEETEKSETDYSKSYSAEQHKYLPPNMPKLALSHETDEPDKPLKFKNKKRKKIMKSNKKYLVPTTRTNPSKRVDHEDSGSELEPTIKKTKYKLLRKKIATSSSDFSDGAPEPVKPFRNRKSNRMKLLFKTLGSLMPKNLNTESESLKMKRNKSQSKKIQKLRESSMEHHKIETASPELSEGTPEDTESLKYRKSDKMKLLSYTPKKEKFKKKPMLSKQNVVTSREAENSDFEEVPSDRSLNMNKSADLEPTRQQNSPEFGYGTPDPIKSRKRKRTHRMKLFKRLSMKKNKLNVSGENIASTSKPKKDESSETSGFEYQERRDSQLTELSEGTPEPIQPKIKRPARMTLLPTTPKKYNKKRLLKEKVETSELEESEIDIIVEEMKSQQNLTTPKPRNDSELSLSLDLSDDTPEPTKPKRNRSPRIKPSSSYSRPVRMMPSVPKRRNIMTLIRPPNSPSLGSSNSPLPDPTTSPKSHSRPAMTTNQTSPKSRLHAKSSEATCSRTVPRTRVLVTPERKQKMNTSKKNLRRLAEKRNWIRIHRKKIQKKTLRRAETSSSSRSETSSDSGNIGDCSGLGDDDDIDYKSINNIGVKGRGYKKGNSDAKDKGNAKDILGSGPSGMTGRSGVGNDILFNENTTGVFIAMSGKSGTICMGNSCTIGSKYKGIRNCNVHGKVRAKSADI